VELTLESSSPTLQQKRKCACSLSGAQWQCAVVADGTRYQIECTTFHGMFRAAYASTAVKCRHGVSRYCPFLHAAHAARNRAMPTALSDIAVARHATSLSRATSRVNQMKKP